MKYSVALGCFSFWNRMEKPIYVKAWITGLILKINIFLWLLLQDKVLTLDNLAKKGQIIHNKCSLCKKSSEMVKQFFIHCPYSSEVWNLMTKGYEVSLCNLENIQQLFG